MLIIKMSKKVLNNNKIQILIQNQTLNGFQRLTIIYIFALRLLDRLTQEIKFSPFMVNVQTNSYCYGMDFVLKIINTILTILGYYNLKLLIK